MCLYNSSLEFHMLRMGCGSITSSLPLSFSCEIFTGKSHVKVWVQGLAIRPPSTICSCTTLEGFSLILLSHILHLQEECRCLHHSIIKQITRQSVKACGCGSMPHCHTVLTTTLQMATQMKVESRQK